MRLRLDAAMRTVHPELPYDDDRYGELAERMRALLWTHAVAVLDAGVDAVLDWNCWSVARRARWRDVIVAAGHAPELHHVDVPIDETVLRAFVDLFEPPGDEHAEGMPVVTHAG